MIFRMDLHTLPNVMILGRVSQRRGYESRQKVGRHVLILVHSGDMCFEVDGTRHTLGPGDWLLMLKGSAYRLHTREGCNFAFVHFEVEGERKPAFEAEPRPTLDPKGSIYQVPHAAHVAELPITGHMLDDRIWPMITECDIKRSQRTAGSKLWIDLCFAQMLLLLSHQPPREDENHPAVLGAMLRYVHEHYMEELSLGILSEVFQLSRQYIMRLFQKHLHMTATQYITQVRMSHALEFLRHAPFRVGEVAEMLGYHSTYYFCRVFRKHFGLSPTEYREQD